MDKMTCLRAVLILVIIDVARCTPLDNKIVGGEDASIEDFPYQVSIRIRGSHYCGGSILDKETILSAGHCTTQPLSFYTVHAGTNDLEANTEPHKVTQIIKHENYGTSHNKLINDIALFKISPPIEFSKTQQPVKLPRQNQTTPAGSLAVVTGWGKTRDHGQGSHILQKVSLPIVAVDECRRLYDGELPENEICAGDLLTGGKGTCQGDSGGPLVADGVQVGIVSWGRVCADRHSPGVFTEVAAYRDWISSKNPTSLF